MFLPKIKNNQGIALVMALIILSVAMLTGLFLNSIIVGEVRISLNTANVVSSYYAAETGIERGLYWLTTDKLEDETYNRIYYFEHLGDLDGNGIEDVNYLANNSSYTYANTSIKAAEFSAFNVSNNNPAHVSIVDPLGRISAIDWSAQTSIGATVNWQIKGCFPEHASDRLETTIYSFASGFNNISSIPDVEKIVTICDCAYLSEYCRGVGVTVYNDRFYRFVFRPLDGEANINFRLQDDGILSETLTQVDGRYKNSEYRLQARVPALTPTSDIFSFVIFSEEDLSKGQ